MDRQLRQELLDRVNADQAAVRAFREASEDFRKDFDRLGIVNDTPWPWSALEWSPEEEAPELVKKVWATTRANTVWFRGVVERVGWPGRSLVGEDGADAAWMLLTHSCTHVSTIGTPEDLQFRRNCIPLLEEAVRQREADPRHLASNVDSVCEQSGELSKYGVLSTVSETGEVSFFFPAHEPAVLNQNRAAVGLPTFEEDVDRKANGALLLPYGVGRDEPGMEWPPKD